MPTVLKPPSSSHLTTVAAGKYGVRIKDKTSGDWVWLNGLTKFEPKPKQKLEDDSDIYGDAYSSQIAMGNGIEIGIEGMVKGSDVGTFTTDPGLAILVAAMYETGFDNVVEIQYWRHDDLPDAFEVPVAVEVSLSGGKPDEAQKFTGTLHGRGKPTAIAKPQVSPVTKTLTVTASSGNVTVTVDGNTATFAFGANGAAIQTALAALPNVGAGNVTVSGTGPFTVTFANGASAVTATGATVS
jgi:hypothetical protein